MTATVITYWTAPFFFDETEILGYNLKKGEAEFSVKLVQEAV